MADYSELVDLMRDQEMVEKAAVAVIVATETVRTESGATTNHANRLLWAKEALDNPLAMAKRMWPSAIAQNKSATVGQITGATDAAIQSNIEAVIDIFATGA